MKYALFFLWACLALSAEHPIYVSVMELSYKPEAQRLEVALKVFGDDLQAALSKEQGRLVEIGTDREDPKADSLIEAYLRRHLRFRTEEGKELVWKIIGREQERRDFFANWIYVEVPNTPAGLRALQIRYSLLMDHIPSQHNVLTLKSPSGLKRFSLWKDQSEVWWRW